MSLKPGLDIEQPRIASSRMPKRIEERKKQTECQGEMRNGKGKQNANEE